MRRARKPAPAALDPLFESILAAPDRDRCPLAREVISFQENDEGGYLSAVESAAERAVALERRGAFHGHWAVLDPSRLPSHLRPAHGDLDDARFEALLASRWHATRPIVLRGILRPVWGPFEGVLATREDLRARLAEPGGLRSFLNEHAELLEPDFRVLGKRVSLFDAERDVERVMIESIAPRARGRDVADLWLKSSWLSTNDLDASLRLRFSFGSEREDDASRDILRQRLVAGLAERLLPEAALVTGHPALVPLLESFAGEKVLFTQAIAYWNAKSGGALFHHDAFAEDTLDGGTWRQLGVCYAQLTGSTAWLALSLDDLALRCREFLELLAEGDLPWVRAQLFEGPRAPVPGGLEKVRSLVTDEARARAELALPGQGVLGPLVNRGSEFTSFLADAGHAHVLDAGDVILLPNRGLQATCMHSVFTAGEDTAYALSFALRPDREAPEEAALRAQGPRSRKKREPRGADR